MESFLNELQHSLVIIYEYGKISKIPPITFQSSIELLDKPEIMELIKEKPDQAQKNQENNRRKIPYRSMKFTKADFVKLNNQTIYYIPTKQTFQNLFECIENISPSYDLEDLLTIFQWKDFEQFIADALEQHGYIAYHTFRFQYYDHSQHKNRRHEIDIIARDKSCILLIDAKHWNLKTASKSALINAAKEQTMRVQNLLHNPHATGELLQKLNISPSNFKEFYLYPIIIVSSNIPLHQISYGITFLSILKFNDFLMNFTALKTNLTNFHLSHTIFQTTLLKYKGNPQKKK